MLDLSNYDKNNIFAKIIDGRLPCDKIYEDSFFVAFNDIQPKAMVHVLMVPKHQFVSFQSFIDKASGAYIMSFFQAVKTVTDILRQRNGIEDYRIIINQGSSAGQEVPHFHVHLLSNDKRASNTKIDKPSSLLGNEGFM